MGIRKVSLIIGMGLTLIQSSYSQYESIEIQGSYEQIVYLFNDFDWHKNGFSYSTGAEVGYFLTNRIVLGTGFYFEKCNFNVDYGPGETLARELEFEKHTYTYFRFPLFTSVGILSNETHSLRVKASADLAKLKNREITLYYDDGTTRDGVPFSTVDNRIFFLSFGVEYTIMVQRNIFIKFSPKFRMRMDNSYSPNDLAFLTQISIGYKFK